MDKRAKKKHQKEIKRKKRRKHLRLHGYPPSTRDPKPGLSFEEIAKLAKFR